MDDPRSGNAGLHDFHELLFIALCSVLCGGQGAVDMALFATSKEPFPLATIGASLRRVLTLANGVPSHDTFSRLFPSLIRRRSAPCSSVSWPGSPSSAAAWRLLLRPVRGPQVS